MTELDYTERRGKRFVWLLAAFFSLILLLFYVYKIFVPPLILGSIFSYAMLPAVDWCQKHRMRRSSATILILGISLLILAAVLTLLLPVIYQQLINLFKLTVIGVKDLESIWIPKLKLYMANEHWFTNHKLNEFFSQINILSELADRGEGALDSIIRQTPILIEVILTLVMMPIFSFFVLRDFYELKEKVFNIIPVDLREPWTHMLDKINLVLREVLKGQITVALLLAVLYAIGFSVAGIDAGLVIGLIAGVCRAIPYLDIFVGAFLCLLSILANFNGFGQFIAVALIILGVQILDGMYITPHVVGKRAGLHPLLVIASVIAFGGLFGFLGVLLAIPIIATIKVMVQFFMPYYFNSHYYKPRR